MFSCNENEILFEALNTKPIGKMIKLLQISPRIFVKGKNRINVKVYYQI